jgi:hypothetical protein
MHAYTIAATLAMAGSSMAVVLQSPPSTRTATTVYTTETRRYGPTCASVAGGHGPTCAGVGPAAHTPAALQDPEDYSTPDQLEMMKALDLLDQDGQVNEDEMNEALGVLNEDGQLDQDEFARMLLGEPENDEPEPLEPEPIEPEPVHTVHVVPVHVVPVHIETPTSIAPPTHTASPTRITPQVNRVAPAPTSTACPKCQKPDEKLKLLNDTRKNKVRGFKLFAEFDKETPFRFALHVREHDRKDIWNIKMVPAIGSSTADKHQQRLASMNLHQPRWNLADNRLETRSNDSAPVNDTLYFRLYDAKVKKDSSEHKGPIMRSVLTTNPNKNKYGKEGNTKLLAKKSWQLRLDESIKSYDTYTLENKDIKGSFFWCLGDEKVAALVQTAIDHKPEVSDPLDFPTLIGDHMDSELIYADADAHHANMLHFSKDGKPEYCLAVNLKVR